VVHGSDVPRPRQVRTRWGILVAVPRSFPGAILDISGLPRLLALRRLRSLLERGIVVGASVRRPRQLTGRGNDRVELVGGSSTFDAAASGSGRGGAR